MDKGQYDRCHVDAGVVEDLNHPLIDGVVEKVEDGNNSYDIQATFSINRSNTSLGNLHNGRGSSDVNLCSCSTDSSMEENDMSELNENEYFIKNNVDECEALEMKNSCTTSRRTISEIDWHELTKFAQGELFDLESTTAKEVERIVSCSKGELASAFKLLNRVDFDMVVEEAEKCVTCVINSGWQAVSHCELPQWLRDNDFLWHMHRPQLPSFKECFCSMFRLHTETGNIWTHFFGMILLIFAMLIVYLRPKLDGENFLSGYVEYIVFGCYFVGSIVCLMFSWLYHTCCCHSEKASSFFSKLDYTGIACMIMGGFVPCIYYGFYCRFTEKVMYIVALNLLGAGCIVVSLWNKFASPKYRPLRAGLFMALGLSIVIPCLHMIIVNGFMRSVNQAALGWMGLMAISVLGGATIYAVRIPERIFPGKCNLVFQSHQIFHILVVIAAFLHMHGCCEMASYRIQVGRYCSRSSVNVTDMINSTLTDMMSSTLTNSSVNYYNGF